ncbi:MAG: TolC family protein [Sulfurimonadaceae bacterium]|nr:TolC family protein [Sulfurimonadaceae bacterium]
MKLIGALSIAAALFSSSLLFAQERLDLERALEIVKKENLEIKTADYALQSAEADANIASGYHFGKLDFTQNVVRSDDAGNVFGFKLTSREASFNDFGFDEFLAQMGGLPGNAATLLATQPQNLNYPEARTFYQSKLTYQLPIFVGGKLSAYSNIMEAMEQLKGLDKEAVVEEKLYQTRKSFYDMALLDSSITHFTVILDNIKTLETMAQTMIEEGYAKKVDLLEVQAKRANVERMINEMDSNKVLLFHYISFLLNRTVTAIETPAEDVPMCYRSDLQVLSNNIDLKKAAKGLEITDEMVSASYAGFMPQIGAFAEVSTADDTFLGDADEHKSYTVGARLSWNLFNGGIDYHNFEKAKVEHLKMQTQVELAHKGIALKLHQIRTEITKYDLEIQSLTKEVELASEIYYNYEGRYREHLASMSDVIIKQSEQIEKVLALLMAKNKRNERVFALQRLANGEEIQ